MEIKSPGTAIRWTYPLLQQNVQNRMDSLTPKVTPKVTPWSPTVLILGCNRLNWPFWCFSRKLDPPDPSWPADPSAPNIVCCWMIHDACSDRHCERLFPGCLVAKVGPIGQQGQQRPNSWYSPSAGSSGSSKIRTEHWNCITYTRWLLRYLMNV